MWLSAPGRGEADGDPVAGREVRPLFDPDTHDGPEAIRDIGELFAPLDLDLDPSDESVGLRRNDALAASEGNIDFLAWYRTFRLDGPWGIFIREAGIESIATAIARQHPPECPAILAAASKLYLHEYGHFLFDVACSALEDVVGAELYLPHHVQLSHGRPYYHEAAEALCNAFAYRSLAAPGYKRQLKAVLRAAPPGYGDFSRHLSDETFTGGIELVLGEVLRGIGGDPSTGTRGLFDDRLGASVGPWLVPVHLVSETATDVWVFSLITALAAVGESPTFQKELKKLPAEVQLSWAEEVKPQLMTDVRVAGHFKRLVGGEYSVRVAQKYRVIIHRESDGGWTAERLGHRNKVYR